MNGESRALSSLRFLESNRQVTVKVVSFFLLMYFLILEDHLLILLK